MKKFSIAILVILLTSIIFITQNDSKKMKTIETKIIIDAPVEQVWATFTKFENYKGWNPFIESLKGNVAVGEQIEVRLTPPENNAMTFKPKVLVFDKNKELRWLGKLFIKGIFDGEHYYQFVDNQDGTTTFIHGENFNGILVGLMGGILKNTEKGFKMMNEALKKEVENTQV